jgi:hypothetical protein
VTRLKPTLFLDVDGVLNAFPKGFQKRAVELGHIDILYPTKHTLPFMHWAWAEFEVYWCTAWDEKANKIAKWACLEERPCVADVRCSHVEWKLQGVKAFLKGRKQGAVWIEDGISPAAEAWVSKRKGLQYVYTDPKTGITKAHCKPIAALLGLSMEAWK